MSGPRASAGPSGRLPFAWGATAQEVARPYPADAVVAAPPVLMTRAIDVAAAPATTWRWLCQLAVAPYSYDLIDNLGRRSPRTLTPGAERLVLGQTMATIFELVALDDGHQWTGLTRSARPLGKVAMTYAAEPAGQGVGGGSAGRGGEERSRIVCRIAVAGGGRLARAGATALAWGDLVMIRKQLHNLQALAERT